MAMPAMHLMAITPCGADHAGMARGADVPGGTFVPLHAALQE
jgi:hypothetical protein